MRKKYIKASPRIFLMAFVIVFYAHSEAGKLALVTDDPDYAETVKTLILRTEPYASMHAFTIDIQNVDSNTLNTGCVFNSQVERNMACTDVANRYASELNADKVMVIKKDKRVAAGADVGGIGGAMTTASDPRTALHEIHHLVGFADEYNYANATEANLFCAEGWFGPNITYLREAAPYSSDLQARTKHARYIPWYQRMTAQKITTGSNLGTPEPHRIGLYRSQSCANNTNGVSSWRPGDETTPTIMETLDGNIPSSHYPYIYAAFGETVTADPGASEADTPPQVNN